MEDLIIPGWALYVLVPIFFGVVGWLVQLTKLTYRNQHDIAINTANDKQVSAELDKIYDRLSDLQNSFDKSFDKMERRIDAFMASELTLLKQLITGKQQ